MDERTTYVAPDDSKRKVVVAILRPGAMEREQRELPKEPPLIRRLFQRLVREGHRVRSMKRHGRRVAGGASLNTGCIGGCGDEHLFASSPGKPRYLNVQVNV